MGKKLSALKALIVGAVVVLLYDAGHKTIEWDEDGVHFIKF